MEPKFVYWTPKSGARVVTADELATIADRHIGAGMWGEDTHEDWVRRDRELALGCQIMAMLDGQNFEEGNA